MNLLTKCSHLLGIEFLIPVRIRSKFDNNWLSAVQNDVIVISAVENVKIGVYRIGWIVPDIPNKIVLFQY